MSCKAEGSGKFQPYIVTSPTGSQCTHDDSLGKLNSKVNSESNPRVTFGEYERKAAFTSRERKMPAPLTPDGQSYRVGTVPLPELPRRTSVAGPQPHANVLRRSYPTHQPDAASSNHSHRLLQTPELHDTGNDFTR